MESWIRIYKRQFEARKNPYKNPRETGKNRGNLGMNQAQKTPRLSDKITVIK